MIAYVAGAAVFKGWSRLWFLFVAQKTIKYSQIYAKAHTTQRYSAVN